MRLIQGKGIFWLLLAAAGLALQSPAVPAQGQIHIHRGADGTRLFTDRRIVGPDYTYIGTYGRPTASHACQGITPRILAERARPYAGTVRDFAGHYGVDPQLVQAVITVESCFDRHACPGWAPRASCNSCPPLPGNSGYGTASTPRKTYAAEPATCNRCSSVRPGHHPRTRRLQCRTRSGTAPPGRSTVPRNPELYRPRDGPLPTPVGCQCWVSLRSPVKAFLTTKRTQITKGSGTMVICPGETLVRDLPAGDRETLPALRETFSLERTKPPAADRRRRGQG
jgi:hypothetical protein